MHSKDTVTIKAGQMVCFYCISQSVCELNPIFCVECRIGKGDHRLHGHRSYRGVCHERFRRHAEDGYQVRWQPSRKLTNY